MLIAMAMDSGVGKLIWWGISWPMAFTGTPRSRSSCTTFTRHARRAASVVLYSFMNSFVPGGAYCLAALKAISRYFGPSTA